MRSPMTPDEDLVRRLPLPLAQLYRRANNARNSLERHLTAYLLWEAALKLLASVAVVEYAECGTESAAIEELLRDLKRPAVGHWWGFLRELAPVLAAREVPGFEAVRKLVLESKHDDMLWTAGLDAELRQLLENQRGARSTVRLHELFDRLVEFRNKEMHGATGQRSRAFYEQMGPTLLAGVGELLSRLDVLAGRQLLYLPDVRRQSSGDWLIERYELVGETGRRLESLEVPSAHRGHLPRPELLYLWLPPATLGMARKDDAQEPRWVSLHPLVIFDADLKEVLFFHRRRDRQTEYLSYASGRIVKHKDVGGEHRPLLARLLNMELASEAGAAEGQPAPEAPPADQGAAPLPPKQIGEFELVSELGSGGMGVVYRARQPSLDREVALKVLMPGDAKAAARFSREIHALGRVEHPHLVKVFTSGAEGTHWFYAMELIEGATLAAVCDKLTDRGSRAAGLDVDTWRRVLNTVCQETRPSEEPLDGSAREGTTRPVEAVSTSPLASRGYVRHMVELVRQVAEAAHALHEAGVIHRDIKPSNIMVAEDGNTAMLVDLGLAQLADDVEGRLTRTRQFVGTLRYASPEQVLAAGKLDRRSDVYSLGATLWELLTLRPIYGTDDQTPPYQLMQRIQYEEPERLRKHHPAIAADLEAIILKCLEKNPNRRYSTAQELALDLGRWLRNEPVTAQRPTLAYVLGKYIRRHRLRFAVAAALLCTALIAAVTAFLRIDQARREALDAQHDAETAQHETAQALKREQDEHGRAVEAQRAAEEARTKADKERQRAEAGQVQLHVSNGVRLLNDGDGAAALLRFAEALRRDPGGPESARLHRLRLASTWRRCPRLAFVGAHDDWVTHAAFSHDGRKLATAGRDKTARIWDLATGQPAVPPLRHDKEVRYVIFSPDGRYLLTGMEDTDSSSWRKLHLWDTATGAALSSPSAPSWGESENDVAYSPDSRKLFFRSGSEIKCWEIAAGKLLPPLLANNARVWKFCFNRDGTRLFVLSLDGTARVWDAAKGEAITPAMKVPPNTGGDSLAFSPDAKLVAAGCRDNKVRLWDAVAGRLLADPLPHSRWVNHVEFSPDGRRLLTLCDDGSVRLWDTRTGDRQPLNVAHAKVVWKVTFSPDGLFVLTASADHTARVWDVWRNRPLTPPLWHGAAVTHAAFSPDGRRLVSTSWDRAMRVWDLTRSGGPTPRALNHPGDVLHAAFDPDGRRVFALSENARTKGEELRVWETASGQMRQPPLVYKAREDDFFGSTTNQGLLSRDNRYLLALGPKDTVQVWDTGTRQPHGAPLPHKGRMNNTGFRPDGKWLLTLSKEKTIQLWETSSGKPAGDPLVVNEGVRRIAFHPDGRRLLVAQGDKTLQLWDLSPRKLLWQSEREANGSDKILTFSPDGARLVAGSAAHAVRVWDAQSGRPITPHLRHSFWVNHAAFRPDGRQLATAGEDHVARIWSVDTGEPVAPPLVHRAAVRHVEFSPDGRMVLTACEDGTVWLWEAATGHLLDLPLQHREGVPTSRVSPEGSRVTYGGQKEVLPLALFSPEGQRLLTAGWDDAVKIWELPRDERPVQDWRTLAQLLAGQQLHPQGGLVPLDAEALRQHWQHLRSALPGDVTSGPDEILAWHRRLADDAESAGQWFAALWHLNPLIDAEPGNGVFYKRRAQAHFELDHWRQTVADCDQAARLKTADADVWFYRGYSLGELGQWKQAIEDCSRAIDLQPARWWYWARRGVSQAALRQWGPAEADYTQAINRQGKNNVWWLYYRRGGARAELDRWKDAIADLARSVQLERRALDTASRLALAQLGAGDLPGYRATCADLFERFGSGSPNTLNTLAWIGALVPDNGIKPAVLVQCAEQAVNASPKSPSCLNTLALALYRAGRFGAALRRIREAVALQPDGGSVWDWLILAMTHERLGQREQARQWLEKALRPPTEGLPWHERLELRLLRREAQSRLDSPSP